jgi:YidC/Oxa1 family membrane protein insertase
MEKRVIIAFVLSIAVVWIFQSFFAPAPVTPPAPSAEAVEQAAVSTAPASASAIAEAPVTPEGTTAGPAPTEIAAPSAQDMSVDTTLYTATLSNVGGVLKSFKLKAYSDAGGRPIELINQDSGQKLGWPLTLITGDAQTDELLSKSNFTVERNGDQVKFEFAGNGVYAKKSLTFSPENYEVTVESEVTRDGAKAPHKLVWRGGFGDQSVPPAPANTKALVYEGSSFERVDLGDLEEDRYFMASFILPQPSPVQITKQDFPGPESEPVSTISLSTASGNSPVRVYVGPKAETWLAKADTRLPEVVDYGFFEVITRPLLFALLWIHSYIGNFGWAIILLTILINLILFPLRLKQQVSMQKMQKLQPQMRTLQDRYKKLKANDPRRAEVQMEMMNLYKQNGVNPMGGCLPLLLQMPLLFAFWNMLSVSIDLRQAPFILWIRDLSQHDPYYVIPILMAVSMIISTKMMPTSMDPAQARMMMIMPVVLSVMFLWLQAGVTLHYLTSNVVGIGQQWFILKYWTGDADVKLQRRAKKKPSSE